MAKKDDKLGNMIFGSGRSRNFALDAYFGTAEKTSSESSFVAQSQLRPYNPDDLWQKTGDYSIYEEMEHDDQVSVAMDLKIDMVIGEGFDVVVKDKGQEEMAREVQTSLEEDPSMPFDDQLAALVSDGYMRGFAIGEKIFHLRDDNYLTFDLLKVTEPNSWLLHTDEKGKVTRYEQRGRKASFDVKPDSIIHFINRPRYQNPYGTSDLRKAYEAWMVKRHLIRFFSIFSEKYAGPIPIARYDHMKVPQSKVDDMLTIIKRFQQKTGAVIPKAFELEFLESAKKGETYKEGINLFNMFIGRALVIPDLLGFSGQGSQNGGSQALGREQMGVFFKHIGRRRKTLERIVNKHIVQPMFMWNYNLLENWPQFKLKPLSEDDTDIFVQRFIDASRANIYKPSDEEINHFRSLINFPEGEVDRPEPPPQLFPSAGMPGEEEVEEKESAAPAGKEGEEADIEEGNEPEKQEFRMKKPEGNFHKRVDFNAVGSQMDASVSKVMSEGKILTQEIFEDIYDQIAKKKILDGNGKPERIQTIKIKKLKQLQLLLKKNFRQLWNDSTVMAKSELIKQTFDSSHPDVLEFRKKCFVNELASEDFLEFLESETFDYVGKWEFAVKERVAQELRNAIKGGRPLSSVIGVLDNEGRRLAEVSLERYSRTKSTEVVNRARLAEWNKSDIVAAYQYSAVLDGRTTVICAGLNGKIFKLGTEPRPPLHFNCRSILIPITKFEDFKIDKKVGGKTVDKFFQDNVGKGFEDNKGKG